jgi:membrane protein DedA with SNARE-associated domain
LSLTHWITEAIQQYAYQPEMVYLLVLMILVASSFGFPIPEEVVIITTSLLAYMSLHPDIYPPPKPGAQGVNVYILMTVCFLSVFLSDLIVFQIGRTLGRNITDKKWFQSLIKPKTYRKVKFWAQKYGALAAAVFRFLPGLRFPGHMACGAVGIPAWKFIIVDMLLIIVTIPTQVYLIAHYGEVILAFVENFRYVLLVLFLGVLVYIGIAVYANLKYLKNKNQTRLNKKQLPKNI